MAEVIIIAIIAVLTVSAAILWKNPHMKKYRKYLIILAPAAFILVLTLISRGRYKKSKEEKKSDDLRNKIDEIKEDIKEVQMETAIEISAARAKNEEKIKELKEVKKIKDKSKRRKRLADMIG